MGLFKVGCRDVNMTFILLIHSQKNCSVLLFSWGAQHGFCHTWILSHSDSLSVAAELLVHAPGSCYSYTQLYSLPAWAEVHVLFALFVILICLIDAAAYLACFFVCCCISDTIMCSLYLFSQQQF